jgi:RNA polymerase subunit RPABC4/transcription elongation factor Spt4
MGHPVTKTIEVEGNANAIWSAINQFYLQHGYQSTGSNPPTALSFKRGDLGGTILSIQSDKVETDLAVMLTQQGNKVSVSCNYDIKTHVVWGINHERHVAALDGEVESLRASLYNIPKQQPPVYMPTPQQGTPQQFVGAPQKPPMACPKCMNLVSPEFAVCPYCATPLKNVISNCSQCNRELSPEFKVCPFCGGAR